MVLSLVVAAVAAILVVFFTAPLIAKSGGQGANLLTCEGQGGVLRAACDSDVSIKHIGLIKNKDGKICCMPKPGVDEDKYKEWAGIKDESTSSGDGTGSGSAGGDNIGTTSDKGWTTKNTDVTAISGDRPHFVLNGIPVPLKSSENIITMGKEFTIEVTNMNNYASPMKCYLNIRSGTELSGQWTSSPGGVLQPVVNGLVHSEKNCSRATALTLQGAISAEGYYKINYGVSDSGTSVGLDSDYIVLNVVKPVVETPSTPPAQVLANAEIKTRHARILRGNRYFCFFNPRISGFSSREGMVPNNVFSVDFDGNVPCLSSEDALTGRIVSSDNTRYVELTEGQTTCVYSFEELSYEGETRNVEKTDRFLSSSCDVVVLANGRDGGQYCEKDACSDFSKEECLDYNKRTNCHFIPNCYYKKPNVLKFQFTGSCQSCHDLTQFQNKMKCAFYDTKENCEENDCFQNDKCQWIASTNKCVFA